MRDWTDCIACRLFPSQTRITLMKNNQREGHQQKHVYIHIHRTLSSTRVIRAVTGDNTERKRALRNNTPSLLAMSCRRTNLPRLAIARWYMYKYGARSFIFISIFFCSALLLSSSNWTVNIAARGWELSLCRRRTFDRKIMTRSVCRRQAKRKATNRPLMSRPTRDFSFSSAEKFVRFLFLG